MSECLYRIYSHVICMPILSSTSIRPHTRMKIIYSNLFTSEKVILWRLRNDFSCFSHSLFIFFMRRTKGEKNKNVCSGGGDGTYTNSNLKHQIRCTSILELKMSLWFIHIGIMKSTIQKYPFDWRNLSANV